MTNIIKEYVEFTDTVRSKLESKELDNFHMIFGMATEVGELTDVFKKNMAYGKEIDWINVQEELGDLMWYIGGFCKINNLDLERILQTNMEKLKARYPEKFSSEKAINRDLDKEREILEK